MDETTCEWQRFREKFIVPTARHFDPRESTLVPKPLSA